MTRDDWVTRKAELCPRLVQSYSSAANQGRDPMARTPFCNLDNSTDLVCKAVEEAQLLVIQAQKVQDGGMPVVDVNLAFDRLETVVVSFAIREAAPGPPARHPQGVPLVVVVAPVA